MPVAPLQADGPRFNEIGSPTAILGDQILFQLPWTGHAAVPFCFPPLLLHLLDGRENARCSPGRHRQLHDCSRDCEWGRGAASSSVSCQRTRLPGRTGNHSGSQAPTVAAALGLPSNKPDRSREARSSPTIVSPGFGDEGKLESGANTRLVLRVFKTVDSTWHRSLSK